MSAGGDLGTKVHCEVEAVNSETSLDSLGNKRVVKGVEPLEQR